MKKSSEYVRNQDLISKIESLIGNTNPVAVIGGHYFLLYESKSDALKPSVYEDFEEGTNQMFSMQRAKNFPLATFRIAVDLIKAFRLKSIRSNCVMVVNDDLFQKKDFRGEHHHEIVKNRASELRKNYFRVAENLPKSFLSILNTANIKIQDFFEFFDNSVGEDSYMPKQSLFISERKLCKRFKKNSKKIFRNIDIISASESTKNEEEYQDLVLIGDNVNQYCLIEDGLCNCGGKAFELYYEIINKGYTNIVFFVPNECIEAVNKGAEIMADSHVFAGLSLKIINISRIEQNPNALIENNMIKIDFITS